MAIRKEIFKKDLEKIDIEKLIDKGAKVKADNDKTEWTNINLRIRVDMLEDIEQILKSRVGITRTGWILEVIYKEIQETKFIDKSS